MDPIPNRPLRRLLLERHGLSNPPTAPFGKQELLELVEHLGYVQIDSINVIERAHHLILHARNRRYRREMLSELLESDRDLFEHWTHDACVIPTSYFPHWKHRFDRARRRLTEPRWRKRLGPRREQLLAHVRARIECEGPLRTRDFENAGGVERSSWWGWSQEKTALEFLWRCGELGICRREGFEKVYDRIEKVVAEPHRDGKIEWRDSVDWKCREALHRLGAATPAQIAGFWGSFATPVARQWADEGLAGGDLVWVCVEGADGTLSRPCIALPDLFEQLAEAPAPQRAMRVLSPFDPLIRDRKRTAAIFGFDYRVEVFVPAPTRKYGYSVLPILEGDRFTGRIALT
ncbi:MAG: winged helix-turn-helix domain-containing protein, partial [bacterium]|nr:winged helix-turn-helix domain-containing protein [bacterium]